jgi:hypothetical protein
VIIGFHVLKLPSPFNPIYWVGDMENKKFSAAAVTVFNMAFILNMETCVKLQS